MNEKMKCALKAAFKTAAIRESVKTNIDLGLTAILNRKIFNRMITNKSKNY